MNQNTTETGYEPPQLRELGSVESLTKANLVGLNLDGNYEQGKPVEDGILS